MTMHPARLSFLAFNHSQQRLVVSYKRENDGSQTLLLECGHTGHCVAHMDASKTISWPCHKCGEAYVRSASQYANEFKD